MDNLEICRLCLKRDKELLNIFSDNIIEINVWEKIQKYLYLHIKAGGNLSKSICLDCLERIKHFDSFFKEVEANQIKYQKDFVVLCDKKSPEQSNTGTESKVCEPPAKWFKQEIKVEPEFQINSDHDNLPKTSLELASENCDVYNINVKSEHDNVELSYMVDNHSEEDTLSGLESGKNVLPVTFLQTNMELNLPNSSSFGSDKFPTNCEVEEHEKSHPRNKIDKRLTIKSSLYETVEEDATNCYVKLFKLSSDQERINENCTDEQVYIGTNQPSNEIQALKNEVRAFAEEMNTIKQEIAVLKAENAIIRANQRTNQSKKLTFDKIYEILRNPQDSPNVIATNIVTDSMKNDEFEKIFNFPLTKSDSIQRFDKKIQHDSFYMEYLVERFTKVGGINGMKNGFIVGKRIINLLFTTKVLTEFSWTGVSRTPSQKKKLPFQSFTGITQIFDRVLKTADSRWSSIQTVKLFKDKTLKHSRQTNQAYERKIKPKLRDIQSTEKLQSPDEVVAPILAEVK